jgi:hypothetical protein
MRVVSLINGSLSSETSSIYALHYAKKLECKVSLVYVKEKNYSKDLDKSFENIKHSADFLEVDIELLVLENLKEFKGFVKSKDVDMLFCSSRHNHSIFERSFAQTIVKLDLEVDLAIMKIIKLFRANSVDNIILPIRGAKLSVKKFTLFYTFALAYDAKAEIYSIDKLSKSQLNKVDSIKIKNRLKELVFDLRHYFRIAVIMNFKFNLKHDYTLAEGEKIKTHIVENGFDLAIVGAHHNKNFFGAHPIDTLFENPIVNTIYFIAHKEEL